MKTITEQLISHDENGLPKGMLIDVATFDGATFVSTERHSLSVVNTSLITTYTDSFATLESQKAALQNQVNALNSEKTTLTNQVASLQNQLTDLPSLQSQLAEALALVEEYRPYDPNQIKSASFYERIDKDELFALGVLAAIDEPAKSILTLLSAYKANSWQVLLDDPQVTGAMQYLQGAGLINDARRIELLRPATKDEAYE